MSPLDPANSASPLPGAGRNESLVRAFEILHAIAKYPDGASVAELAVDTALPRSTVTRMLASLFDIGAVVRPGSARKWVIGPAITNLASSASPLVRLQEQGALVLQQVTEELGETSMLAVPTGRATAWVVEEARSARILGVIDSWVGRTVSSSASGFVRMLLAELAPAESGKLQEQLIRAEFDRTETVHRLAGLQAAIEAIRKCDFSVVIDELEEGLAGVGYPVRVQGKLVAMLAVYMPSARFNPAIEAQIITSLRSAANMLSEFLVAQSARDSRP